MATIVAARIALRRGRVDDAVGHAGRAIAAADENSDYEAFICAAEVAAHHGAFADARRHAATAFEAIVTTDDIYSVARVCATAIGIEADRVEVGATRRPSNRGRRRRGPSGCRRADDPNPRDDRTCRGDRRRHPARDRGLAHRRRSPARPSPRESDADQWADVADRFDALAVPYHAAIARYHEADARLRSRSGHQQAAAAAAAALATAEQLGATPLAEQVRLLAQRGRLDLTESPEPAAAEPDPLQALGISAREAEVLRLLGLGRTNRQIANELYISEKTASVHVTHLLRKLGVANRIEASAIAQRLEPPAGN